MIITVNFFPSEVLSRERVESGCAVKRSHLRLSGPVVGIVLSVLIGCSLLNVKSNADSTHAQVDFAIYNNPHLGYEVDGVWKDEVAAIEEMLNTYGWTYEV